ncbi:HAMP domain-containing sensor histidine kinase [Streptomyces sp. NPDC050617]|uniref:sensor histidine kinase n=1 Tax=Streptomyces sp. NPDC050617 TaxID=3154628 RepID=UPI003430DC9E
MPRRAGPGAARRTRSPHRTWSLRTRLVVSAVALVAVVCAVIATVTTIALRTSLYDQLDARLAEVAGRAAGPPRDPRMPVLITDDSLRFVSSGGQPLGTIGAVLDNSGSVVESAISVQQRSAKRTAPPVGRKALTAAQIGALTSISWDGRPHTADIPGQGEYRVKSASGVNGTYLVGIPTREARDTLSTLIVAEICVTAAGLVAAALAGTAIVRIALRPLRRVAATATRVSETPLHSGEVALHERVPAAEADPHTEVGQVGAALNRMLGHVGSALAARQESETRVRQFVADASHELRTPLASIRGYAELTRRGREETGPDTRHALGRIESEAHRMSGLVEDLLLLARLDAGRPLSRTELDLSPLVVDAVSDARAAGPDHAWVLELPDRPALLQGESARLHQVLVNLFANARTHTPPGTTVTARVERRGQRLVLSVEDDGPGIPAELRPHVFERFARGDASRSRNAGSTGLGLAIVQAVVEAHGGRVTMDSVPGRTVFAVHLPAAAGSGERSGPVGEGGPAEEGGSAEDGGPAEGAGTVEDGGPAGDGGVAEEGGSVKESASAHSRSTG